MRSSSLFRVLLAVSLLALFATFARAGIAEANDSIVDSRAHKFLAALSDNVGTEDTVLPKGHAVATLSMNGCNLSVLVVGPVEGDAKAYARAIDAWRARQGFPGDVQWSQEDDAAAAKYAYRPGRIGDAQGATTVDLPALRETLLKVEPQTRFAVADAVWSKVDLGFPPDATSAQGTRYWNLTGEHRGLRPIVGTIVLPAWMPRLMLAWFLIPIVGVLGGFAVGIVIAKNARIPLPRRRKLYAKVVQGGAFGAIGLHSLLVVATLPTRLFDPMAQLWFGQRFTQLALPIVPLFAIAPLLALPFVNRVENRLMGPSDEERLQQEPAPRPVRPMTPIRKNWIARYRWAFFLVGLSLLGIGLLLPKTVAFRADLTPLGMVIAMLPNFFGFRLKDLPKFVVEPEALDALSARLREHVVAMAACLGMDAPPSRVLVEAIYGRFGANFDRKRGVGLTIGALEELAPDEIDFLVAHELAHAKLGHVTQRRSLILAPVLFTLILMALLLLVGRTAFSVPGFVFTPMLIPIAFMVPYRLFIQKRSQRQEFEADRLAVQATGDPEAARRALRKVTLNSMSPGIHDVDMSSHPAVGARLAALA